MKNYWLDKDSEVVDIRQYATDGRTEKVEVEFSNGRIYHCRRNARLGDGPKNMSNTDLTFPEHLTYDDFLRKSLREMRESGKTSKANEIQEKEYRTAELHAEAVFYNVCTWFNE